MTIWTHCFLVTDLSQMILPQFQKQAESIHVTQLFTLSELPSHSILQQNNESNNSPHLPLSVIFVLTPHSYFCKLCFYTRYILHMHKAAFQVCIFQQTHGASHFPDKVFPLCVHVFTIAVKTHMQVQDSPVLQNLFSSTFHYYCVISVCKLTGSGLRMPSRQGSR